MTDNLKETIDKLNEYASGDEYQRATEDAVELLRQQAQEIEQLKADLNLALNELEKETNECSYLHDKCAELEQEIKELNFRSEE